MLETLMTITTVIFMVGNLLEVGLRLNVAEAFAALRNVRFLATSLLWCFVLGPALAVLLTKIIPLTEPYAIGLVVLGVAPCSPALPPMVKKAGGSLAYMSAFMLIAYVGTVALMPFMVPWLAPGFTADAWTIGKPLVLFIAIPLIIGALIRSAAEAFAGKAAPVVKKVTGLNMLALGTVIILLYKNEIVSAVGTFAIATQLLYYALLGAGSYLLSFGLCYEQKASMTIGACTRNVASVLATLRSVADTPPGSVAMGAVAAFLGAILSGYAAAAVLKRFCAPVPESSAARSAKAGAAG